MDQYVTGALIRRLREERGMTQSGLAGQLSVSDKTVSKWENAKGYPDISLLEPLAAALGISVAELLSGTDVSNANRSSNMLRSKIYVCPVCGNVIFSVGEALISCHGIALPPLSAEEPDEAHTAHTEKLEDEYYVSFDHPMTKEHFLSFAAAVSDNGVETVKFYPEGPAEARFKIRRARLLYYYCNRDGLYRVRLH